MNDIQNEIKAAFDGLTAMTVSGDNVDLLAIAKSHLRKAYKIAEATQAEKEDTDDGGQSNQ